jgi:hypothetical protein
MMSVCKFPSSSLVPFVCVSILSSVYSFIISCRLRNNDVVDLTLGLKRKAAERVGVRNLKLVVCYKRKKVYCVTYDALLILSGTHTNYNMYKKRSVIDELSSRIQTFGGERVFLHTHLH